MKQYDRRTREQRKADESALIAWVCFLLISVLFLSLLVIDATARERAQEAAGELQEAEAVTYDPAWDKPAEERAGCADVFLGEYTLTAYCACSRCCGKWANGYTATGTKATERRTIAVDPALIPYGSAVLLIWPDGTQRSYVAEDCGGGVQGKHIDIYFDSHEEALVFGVQSAMAYLQEAAQ